MLADVSPIVGSILAIVRERTGTDFTGYGQGTIERRIRTRMIVAGASSLADYLELLRASEVEVLHLTERLTIKVSRFYRNAATFEVLRHRVLPSLVGELRPVRVWCAGCGRGEEAYTLAMLLEEAGCSGHVAATDLDSHALERASGAEYSLSAAVELPEDLASRYLEHQPGPGALVRVCEEIRRRVSFIAQDLLSEDRAVTAGPFHIVCCRNVLIYFQPQFQRAALGRLVGALMPDGFLCLGEAEWPMAPFSDALEPLGTRSRVFRYRPAAATGGLG